MQKYETKYSNAYRVANTKWKDLLWNRQGKCKSDCDFS